MNWRKIPGFDLYSIREDGQIRRDGCVHCRTKDKPIKLGIDDKGYYRVSLVSDSGKTLTRQVHSLVAAAFLGPRPQGLIVCHNDGVKLHIHHSNLRYDTHKSNTEDLRKHGGGPRGSTAPASKLTEQDIPQIVDLLATQRFTQAQIAAMFGVTQRIVWHIANGRTWKHVTHGKVVPHAGRGKRKITDAQVVEIRDRHAAGETPQALADEFGLCHSNVCMIVKRTSRASGFFERRPGGSAARAL